MGELLVGVLAYFVRDWSSLQLAAHGPLLLLTAICWTCPESVRWTLAKETLSTQMRVFVDVLSKQWK